MTLSYVPAANAWLKSRNILVPGDWLEACVDWITEENQGVQLSQTQLNGLIYEQWLLADLKEIGSKCLPDQLTSSPKFQLSGTFALQVNSMVDVGKPYYGQLQKVQGTQSGNVDVTAEPAPSWEPKPTRMMMLNLSDGSLSVQGMEYKQIPCLNSQIKPGCKILVKGSVLCRRGILMLTAENLTVLGGEVDALVEDNTPVNSLKRAMEQSLQYSGKDYHQEFSSEGIIRSNNKKLKTEFPSQKIKREPPQSQPQAANSWNKPCRATVPEIKREAAIKQETREIDDEWEDDLDGWMDDMEDFDLDSVPPAPPSSVITQNSAPPNAETTSSKLHAMRAGSNGGQQSTQTKSKMAPQNHQITSSVTNTSQSRSVPLSNSVDQGISRNSLERVNKTKKVTETQYCQTAKQLMVKSDSPHNSAQTGTYSSGQTNLRTNLDIKPSVQHIDLTEQQFSDDDDFLDDLDDFDMSVEGNGDPCSKQSRVSVPQNVKDNACTLNTSGGTLPSSALSVGKKKLLKNTDKTDQREVDVSDIMSSCNQQQASPLATKPHIAGTSEKAGSQVKTARPGETTRQKPPEFTSLLGTETKIKELPVEAMMCVTELPVEAKPFTYLALVKKKIPVSQPIRFSVKAYVSTLTDKLSRPGGKRWQLACKINDGSAVLDVILSDKVLTEMIGFSAQETMEMTHLKADSLLMKKLTKGIKDCQQSLINLLSVMEIVVSPGQDKPEIVSLRGVNDQDILLLQSRVSEALCHIGS